MTVKDNLIAAKALIDTPDKWTKGQHEPFPADGRWTLNSAVDRICWNRPRQFVNACDALRAELWGGHSSLSGFNDAKTHHDIMVLFESAIAAQGDA